MPKLTAVELVAGAGGQSLGLELAGFDHVAAIDNDNDACNTLKLNRPGWWVIEGDVRDVSGHHMAGVDLLAAGVQCPPFSIAGKQLGHEDERDLFQKPCDSSGKLSRAVLLENVRGFATRRFEEYRERLIGDLEGLGYSVTWKLLHAAWYGVPQLRPRFVLVAVPKGAGLARTFFREPGSRAHGPGS